MKKNVCLMLVAVVLAAAISPASANLITNGDFGTGDFTNWTLGTYSYGVAIGNGGAGAAAPGLPAVTSFNITGGGAQNAATFQVGIVSGPIGGDSGGGVSLTQSFTTSGGTINFSAAIASQGGAFANLDGGTFTVLLGNLAIGSYAFSSIGLNAIELATLSGSAVLGPGTYDLEIDISRNFFAGRTPRQYISNIQVDGPTVVPESFTLSLFGTGLASAIAIRGRKKKPA